MVDIYHTMYIKSLQCLFDKYKTRFGLKESDVLYINWMEGGFLLKLWTVAASSDPPHTAPFPTLSPVQSWCLVWIISGLRTPHMSTFAKETFALCVITQAHTYPQKPTHTHKHCSFSGNDRFENSQLSLPLSPVQTASVKSAFFLSINISQWRHRVWTALSVQRGVRSTRWSWKVNILDLHQVPMFYFHSCIHIIPPKISKVLLHAKCTNNANRS